MLKKILTKFFPLKMAIKEGMQVGTGVSIVSPWHTSFGTEPYLIKLGNHVRISGNVIFTTHDGGTWAFRYREEYKNVVKYGRIEVGDNTFIGAGSMIMPNVKIGRDCVIGAYSLVTQNVPDNSVVGGVPAKVICSIDEYAEKVKKSMPVEFDIENYRKDKKRELLRIYGKGAK